MNSTLLSRRDLDFLLFEWLRRVATSSGYVEDLTKRERFAGHSPETFDGTTVTVIPEVSEALEAFARADLLGAIALGYTGYLKSLDYARSRPQGRPVTARDPDTPQIPIIEHPDVKRMLLAQKSYVEGALALALYCARLVDIGHSAESPDEHDSTTLLLDILTPIVKSWPSQWCLEANNLAIQVHGGYGYTRDYDVEQHYRDNRLNPIHEGTHGIQSLGLLGRKVVQRNGASRVSRIRRRVCNKCYGRSTSLASHRPSTFSMVITTRLRSNCGSGAAALLTT